MCRWPSLVTSKFDGRIVICQQRNANHIRKLNKLVLSDVKDME